MDWVMYAYILGILVSLIFIISLLKKYTELFDEFEEKTFPAFSVKIMDKFEEIGKCLCTIMNEQRDISTRLTTIEENMDWKALASKSPLKLTALGEQWVTESSLKNIIEKMKDELSIELMNKYNPKTKYDVQSGARSLMNELSLSSRETRQEFLPVKSYAYENGLNFGKIMRAASVLLRDYYLLKHPEIKE